MLGPGHGGATRGQSESIGVILLVAVVVTTVSVAGGLALSSFATDQTETLSADVTATAAVDSLQFEHRGGDTFRVEELSVVVSTGASSTRIELNESMLSGGDTTFDPGDSIVVPRNLSGVERVEIRLVYDPSGTLLFDGQRTVFPVVADVDLRNVRGSTLTVTVESERRLTVLNVTLRGPDGTVVETFSRVDFTRRGSQYIDYDAVREAGTYTATVTDSRDGTGAPVFERRRASVDTGAIDLAVEDFTATRDGEGIDASFSPSKYLARGDGDSVEISVTEADSGREVGGSPLSLNDLTRSTTERGEFVYAGSLELDDPEGRYEVGLSVTADGETVDRQTTVSFGGDDVEDEEDEEDEENEGDEDDGDDEDEVDESSPEIERFDGITASASADEVTVRKVKIRDEDADLDSARLYVRDEGGGIVGSAEFDGVSGAEFEAEEVTVDASLDPESEYEVVLRATDERGNDASESEDVETDEREDEKEENEEAEEEESEDE